MPVPVIRPCRRCGSPTHSLADSPAPECSRCRNRITGDEDAISTDRDGIPVEDDGDDFGDAA